MLKKLLSILLFTTAATAAPISELWQLPVELSDKNTTVTFKVDSTWVLVEGVTSSLTGKAYYSQPEQPESLTLEIELPVKEFKTGLSLRDDHMYHIMAVEKFPVVRVQLNSTSKDCNPKVLIASDRCELISKGSITIRDVTKDIKLISTVSKNSTGYFIEGQFTLRWEQFNVEDPSNLIARLEPEVLIAYKLQL